jgi:hypothetical protein
MLTIANSLSCLLGHLGANTKLCGRMTEVGGDVADFGGLQRVRRLDGLVRQLKSTKEAARAKAEGNKKKPASSWNTR